MRWHKVLNFRRRLASRSLASLLGIAALLVAAPRAVGADPTSWQHLCLGLGEFAGLVTDYRDQGENLQQAIAAAFPKLQVMPDRVVAVEVAQQVYASPGLNRNQEVGAIFTKCVTPLDSGRLSEQSAVRITELEALPLQPGPNHIARFAADGRDATITLAWRDEGSGRGQDVFLVTMPSKAGTGWRSVDLLPGNAVLIPGGLLADEPHRGDDMLRSLRFARGKVNGQNAILLLIATRAESIASAPSDTIYEVYRLVEEDEQDGFDRVVHRVLPDRYCNADMALTVASGLPLRSSYRGPRRVDGTFTRNGCDDAKAMADRSWARGSNTPVLGTTERSKDKQAKNQ